MTGSTGATGYVGYMRDQVTPPLAAVGGFARMCVLTGKAFLRPFQWREFICRAGFWSGCHSCRLLR